MKDTKLDKGNKNRYMDKNTSNSILNIKSGSSCNADY